MKRSFLVLAVLAVFFLSATAFSKNSFRNELDLIASAESMIRSTYVQEVSDTKLYQGAMAGMLKTLDPYSQYLDPEDYRDLKSSTEGHFAGVGLEISVKGGVLHVITPLDESPADRAGIRPQDVIMKINGVSTKDMTLSDAVRQLRGDPGSQVFLTLIRDEAPKPLEITLQREMVQVKGVREAKLLENSVGYIRVAEFQQQTAADFKKSLNALMAQNMKGLVIDLRNNPGGLFEAAVQVSENFIPQGKLIVSTRGRSLGKNREILSRNPNPVVVKPLVLLVNRGSASGSEIFAGAMQDYALARVIGKKSYGKGCVQSLTGLSDGSAVRITTSFYYTPNGRLIHEIGIIPDQEAEDDPKSPEDPTLKAALSWIREHASQT